MSYKTKIYYSIYDEDNNRIAISSASRAPGQTYVGLVWTWHNQPVNNVKHGVRDLIKQIKLQQTGRDKLNSSSTWKLYPHAETADDPLKESGRFKIGSGGLGTKVSDPVALYEIVDDSDSDSSSGPDLPNNSGYNGNGNGNGNGSGSRGNFRTLFISRGSANWTPYPGFLSSSYAGERFWGDTSRTQYHQGFLCYWAMRESNPSAQGWIQEWWVTRG